MNEGYEDTMKKIARSRLSLLLGVIIIGLILGRQVVQVKAKAILKSDLKQACFDCHPEMKEELEEGKPHQALNVKECISCHTPHAAKHQNLLLKIGDTLCYGCHESNRNWLKDKTVHLPVEYGECLKCHQPHVSPYTSLLRLEGEDLCYQCHDKALFEKEYVHQPVEEGSCTICHQTHSSQNPLLLTQLSPQLCFQCHTTESLKAKHPDFQINRVDCLCCHNPHSTNKKNLLFSFSHDPYTQKECLKCHPDSSGSGPVTARAEDCYACHPKTKEKFKAKKKSHIVSGRDECVFCHNPHGSEREDFVRRSDRPLCTACHQDIRKRLRVQKKGLNRHPEVSAGKCSTCHDSHASDKLKFLKTSPLTLCIDCHKRQKGLCHPVGEKAIDPRDKSPIDCITCHNMMEAEFPQLMRLDGSKQLCNECHAY